jgi:hypothetical protein
MISISKSRFLSGCQCEKKMYFDVFRKDLRPAITSAQQAVFDSGHQIGALAQQLYPGGRDANKDVNGNWGIAINRTKAWLAEGAQTIYEATFSIDGGFAALDILHHQDGQCWAIEVKSSGEIKEYYITDASYQYFIMKTAGVTPDRFFLMHINKDYIKKRAIEVEKLFKLEDITKLVLDNQEAIMAKHKMLVATLETKEEPNKEIGKHCGKPFVCDYKHLCWTHLPDNSVFDIYLAKEKAWDLYKRGIYSLMEAPEEVFTNKRQLVQINGAKTNTIQTDPDKLSAFMSSLSGPLYFFDFETINPTLPILDQSRPFQQVPFQYSLHITDIDGNIMEHREFLAEPNDFSHPRGTDPRRKLLEQLKKDIPKYGSIIVYYSSFEISRLEELAEDFPEEKDFINSLINRVIDLIIPFKSGWYYDPKMGGSNSIKYVLPAIAPEYSYKDLEISNGSDASSIFLSMVLEIFQGDNIKTRKNLLEYCKRDSEGMVVIYKHLRSVCNNSGTKQSF